jgi:hypothetical protein
MPAGMSGLLDNLKGRYMGSTPNMWVIRIIIHVRYPVNQENRCVLCIVPGSRTQMGRCMTWAVENMNRFVEREHETSRREITIPRGRQ